jgi:hypothetical protein
MFPRNGAEHMTPKEELELEISRFGTSQSADRQETMRSVSGPFFDLLGMFTLPGSELGEIVWSIFDDFQGILAVLSISDVLTALPDRPFAKYEIKPLIQLYFFEMQSIFDYIAVATCEVFSVDLNGNIFFSHRKKIINRLEESSVEIDRHMATLLKTCDLFEQLNEWRNCIAHRGQYVSLKLAGGALWFHLNDIQDVKAKYWQDIPTPFFEDGSDYVTLQPFVGFYTGRLLHYLHKWSVLIQKKQQLQASEGGINLPNTIMLEHAMKQACRLL